MAWPILDGDFRWLRRYRQRLISPGAARRYRRLFPAVISRLAAMMPPHVISPGAAGFRIAAAISLPAMRW